MIRIIGGMHRSRKISRVHVNSTKESTDFVREAVFSMLGNNINGIVLDLFAGSGAYGIESLSRGGNRTYFNDSNIKAYQTINKNLASLKLEDQAEVSNLDYIQALDYYLQQNLVFDYIFIDPPYLEIVITPIFKQLTELAKRGTKIIVELDKTDPSDVDIVNYTKLKTKKYGSKKIVIYVKE